MSHHNWQTSSQSDTYFAETQLSTLRQQNKRLIIDMKQFEITKVRNSDELNLLLNTALQLKNHYCSIKQQPFFLTEKA